MPKRYIGTFKLKNGTWRARLTFEKDPESGIRPAPMDFYGKTEGEAAKKREKYKNEKRKRDHEKLTFVGYVKDRFIPYSKELVDAGKLSYTYYQRRKSLLTNYLIEPAKEKFKSSPLRTVLISELRPYHIQQWFDMVKASDISQEYTYRLKCDFRAILKSMREKLPEKPLGLYLERLPEGSLPPRQKPIVMFEAADIFERITNESYPLEDRAIVAAMFILNRRPSEIFALQWSDVDFDSATVHINKRMRQVSGGSFEIAKGTKNKKGDQGMRELQMGTYLYPLLARLKEQAKSTFVFLTKTEKVPYTVQNMRKNWPLIRKCLNLPDGPTFYSLKHLGNSYALANGVSPEAQAWKMGHSSPRMALQTYRQITSSEKIAAVEIYGKLAPAKEVAS